jgi:hypothetical protein
VNLNWLYGKRISRNDPYLAPEIVVVRSLVVDLDTVRDVKARISERFDTVETKYWIQEPGSTLQPKEIAEAHLAGLSSANLGRLYLENHSGDYGGVRVELRDGMRPMISMSPVETEFQDSIAAIMLDSGRPRVRWARFTRFLLLVPFVALLGLWIVLQATVPVPLVGVLFGWLVVAFALVGSIFLVRIPRLKQISDLSYPGHKILPVTREKARERRAASHLATRVAVITAVLSIAGTLVIAWLTGVLHLGP